MSSSDEDHNFKGFPLHDVAEAGDVAAIRALLQRGARTPMEEEEDDGGDDNDAPQRSPRADAAAAAAAGMGDAGAPGAAAAAAAAAESDDNDDAEDDDFDPAARDAVDVDERDGDGATALHVALLSRQLGAVKALLEAGAGPNRGLEGSLPAHIALTVGAVPRHAPFALAALKLLLQHEADPTAKDDRGQTPLHLAANFNLLDCLQLLIDTVSKSGGADGAAASPSAATAAAAAAPPPPLRDFLDARERQGLRALHLAAAAAVDDAAACVAALLAAGASPALRSALGDTPLHAAAAHARWGAARALLAAAPDAAAAANKRGATPAAAAAARRRRGGGARAVPPDLAEALGGAAAAEAEGEGEGGEELPTLVMKHALCEAHYSCPPIRRSGPEPPPENVRRLEVIYDEDTGVLSAAEFAGVEWDADPPRAALADVLRVHEYGYVSRAALADVLRVHEYGCISRLQQLCASIPDAPTAIKHLDGDTAVSRASYEAALRAAGSVCSAIDRVCGGGGSGARRRNRNAFCAVRPPGHHAGPRQGGAALQGSHGFCLLNNVAIGAAYARHMHRGPDGISKVAIVDFDVHHGNGTEEIVRGLAPHEETATVETPFCVGTLHRTRFAPWLAEDDAAHCLFVSVHGYGKKEPMYERLQGGWFYPGSGPTARPEAIPEVPAAVPAAPSPVAAAAAAAAVEPGGWFYAGSGPTARLEVILEVPAAVLRRRRRWPPLLLLRQWPPLCLPPPLLPLSQPALSPEAAASAAPPVAEPEADAAATAADDSAMDVEPKSPPRAQPPPAAAAAAAAALERPCPMILDVGLPLPQPHDTPGRSRLQWRNAYSRLQWRDAHRKEVLPALVEFNPDIILISAGFDAHRKDVINFGYIGLLDEDYEWVTAQLVQVANRCCDGRVVSVLEGGYRIQGGPVSAFGRSVAGHVRALREGCASRAPWSRRDAAWEADFEAAALAEKERRRRAKQAERMAAMEQERAHREAARLAAAARLTAERDAAAAAAAAEGGDGVLPAPADAEEGGGSGETGGARKRRRGGAVDYVALAKKLDSEGGGGAKGGAAR
ncbi:hypothetical protein JKP88DRAFT_350538 [Tribonema minus]|uniref:Histone deacetylase domain-containing protein n=1 Tax=Tribonema minus TaxID=303371 RepID=A0A835YM84_9STRA|nr:hypothetical protein JKP88DRAFT_350538 [Tribonema minus]